MIRFDESCKESNVRGEVDGLLTRFKVIDQEVFQHTLRHNLRFRLDTPDGFVGAKGYEELVSIGTRIDRALLMTRLVVADIYRLGNEGLPGDLAFALDELEADAERFTVAYQALLDEIDKKMRSILNGIAGEPLFDIVEDEDDEYEDDCEDCEDCDDCDDYDCCGACHHTMPDEQPTSGDDEPKPDGEMSDEPTINEDKLAETVVKAIVAKVIMDVIGEAAFNALAEQHGGIGGLLK